MVCFGIDIKMIHVAHYFSLSEKVVEHWHWAKIGSEPIYVYDAQKTANAKIFDNV